MQNRRKNRRKVEPMAWVLNMAVVPVVDIDDPRQLRVASDPHAGIRAVGGAEELVKRGVSSGNGWLHSARQAVVDAVRHDGMGMVLVSVGEYRHMDAVAPLQFDRSAPGDE